ncbi:MAG: MBL fold metallo-hydrolase [Gammaproteobacteria bacterium]|nr:MBL fold metallo-hydrolase [Gammaproteobacteria bacterium]MBQ0838700.1 MBL fold metallo-hydrolase [Gammaproteobacteria bacterium]
MTYETSEPIGVKRFERILRIPSPTSFDVGDINSYVILPEPGSDQLVLIDTGVGTEAAWQSLTSGLQEHGFAIEDITLLLLTHAHTDHFGQASRIREASGCQVWGHEQVATTVAGFLPSPERIEVEKAFLQRFGFSAEMYDKAYDYRAYIGDIFRPCELDRQFQDNDVVAIDGFDLKVIHTPGHCPEEVVFWQQESRQMFSGDHLLPNVTPVCLLDIPETVDGERTHALSQYYRSADKVIPYNVRNIYPSHGDVFHDHRELIAGYKLSTERRLLKVSKILEQHGRLTPFEVGQYLFPKVWEEQLYAVISEVMGHLDLLLDEGFVSTRELSGVIHYELLAIPDPGAVFKPVM